MAWPADGVTNWNPLMKTYVDAGHATDGTHNEAGLTAQVVNVQTGAVNTGTTQIPYDDTIPQKTEGDEYMTLAITPKSATNKLRIDVVFNFSPGSSQREITAALFQDSTVNALACASKNAVGAINYDKEGQQIIVAHYMAAGTISATTFKIRAGMDGGGTLTFNGKAGSRKFGGVMASSITITEIWV